MSGTRVRTALSRSGQHFFVWASLLAIQAHADVEIRSLTGVLEGHAVGGVTVDLIGNIYVADFGEYIWKLSPEGEREVFATGLYGASGNVVDGHGNLLQANYYADSIVRIDRKGQITPFATEGLSGPVGLAVNRHTGEVYVANCRGNSIVRVAAQGRVTPFASSPLLHCPNGLAFDLKDTLYTVNFRDNRMLKIEPSGSVSLFATISHGGLGHLCFKGDRFYLTAYHTHEIYEVSLQGTAKRILGNGERGIVDGGEATARLSFPNGIGCNPWAPRLYINEYVNESDEALPRRAIVREINLAPETDSDRRSHEALSNACCAVFELRQYTLRQGQRDVLIELFDREFVETQEALGMHIVGQFRDEDNPDHFVWIRAFADMDERARGLTAFYHGPVWKAYGRQAAATMIDSDNVLLLHPVDPPKGFNDLPAERPPAGTDTPASSLVIATIYSLRPDAARAFPRFFHETVRPALSAAGIVIRAAFETEESPNNYPDLPVRQGEHVFVWFATYDSPAAYSQSTARLSRSGPWKRVNDQLEPRLSSAPQQLRLRPTGRSLLR